MSRAIPVLPFWAFMACSRENFTFCLLPQYNLPKDSALKFCHIGQTKTESFYSAFAALHSYMKTKGKTPRKYGDVYTGSLNLNPGKYLQAWMWQLPSQYPNPKQRKYILHLQVARIKTKWRETAD